jgi:hypothetical protein
MGQIISILPVFAKKTVLTVPATYQASAAAKGSSGSFASPSFFVTAKSISA